MSISNLYFFQDNASSNEEIYYRLYSMIPEERRRKANRYRLFQDKKNCLTGYLLTIYGIRQSFGIDLNGMEFSFTDCGKPYFKHCSNIYFNISHCKKGVVCGISDIPVGADIQDIDLVNQACYRQVLSHNELRNVQNSLLPNREFIKYWTLKESYVKCLGTGLSGDLKEIDMSCITNQNKKFDDLFFELWEYPDLYVTVCGKQNRIWKLYDNITWNDLISN